MKPFVGCIGMCLIVVICWAQPQAPASIPPVAQAVTPVAQASGQECGPPVYCARTDTAILPYTATPPALGPAGSKITDPSFGTTILRVTDGNTLPKAPGTPFVTPAGGEVNAWNLDSTMFYIHSTTGALLFYNFDPATMRATLNGITVALGGGPEFSRASKYLFYGWAGTKIQSYNFQTGQYTTIVDAVAGCRLAPPSPAYGLNTIVSAGDSRIMGVFGPGQNQDYYIVVYDRALGCRWYNTITGQAGGAWGPSGTVSTGTRFLLHAARLSKDGNWVVADGPGTSSEMVWRVNSLEVDSCGVAQGCGGHSALGYTHMVNGDGGGDPINIGYRPLSDLTDVVRLVPWRPAPVPSWYDTHLSWNYWNTADSTPVCLGTENVHDNPSTPGVPLAAKRAWDNEIVCIATQLPATRPPAGWTHQNPNEIVWRFAHTYSTDMNGFWSTVRGNVSQDGKWYIWTSDWQDSLGALAPQYSSGGLYNYRVDVFMVPLQ